MKLFSKKNQTKGSPLPANVTLNPQEQQAAAQFSRALLPYLRKEHHASATFLFESLTQEQKRIVLIYLLERYKKFSSLEVALHQPQWPFVNYQTPWGVLTFEETVSALAFDPEAALSPSHFQTLTPPFIRSSGLTLKTIMAKISELFSSQEIELLDVKDFASWESAPLGYFENIQQFNMEHRELIFDGFSDIGSTSNIFKYDKGYRNALPLIRKFTTLYHQALLETKKEQPHLNLEPLMVKDHELEDLAFAAGVFSQSLANELNNKIAEGYAAYQLERVKHYTNKAIVVQLFNEKQIQTNTVESLPMGLFIGIRLSKEDILRFKEPQPLLAEILSRVYAMLERAECHPSTRSALRHAILELNK